MLWNIATLLYVLYLAEVVDRNGPWGILHLLLALVVIALVIDIFRALRA